MTLTSFVKLKMKSYKIVRLGAENPKHLRCGKTGKYERKGLKHALNHKLQMNQQEDSTVGWK